MNVLTKNPICLVLQHIIDDPNVIESYLANPDTESSTQLCLPVALRSVLNEYADDVLPPMTRSISPRTLLQYLRGLWMPGNIDLSFWKASEGGLVYLIPYFLAMGADIHYDEDASLVSAVRNGDALMVQTLLKLDANPRAQYDEPLKVATTSGHTNISRMLLDAGADVHSVSTHARHLARLHRPELYSLPPAVLQEVFVPALR